MKKKTLLLTILCVFTLFMTACGDSSESSSASTDTTPAATATATKVEPSKAADTTVAEPTTETVAVEPSTIETTETAATEETTTVVAEEAVLETLVFDIPEDFVETAENYYSSQDTTKASNINYMELPNDGSFSTVGSDILLASMEPQLETLYGIELTLTLIDEEFFEVNGYQAFRYSFEYMIGEYKITQMQCIVDTPDVLCFITYTNFADEGYLDAFNASIQSIRFE